MCCRMVRIYNKLHKALDTLEFFLRNEWQWERHNVDMLKRVMSEEDRQVSCASHLTFTCSVR